MEPDKETSPSKNKTLSSPINTVPQPDKKKVLWLAAAFSLAVIIIGGSIIIYLSKNASLTQQVELDVLSEENDTIYTKSDGNKLLIEVYSPGGIGKAHFSVIQGNLPKKIVIHFYLQGFEGGGSLMYDQEIIQFNKWMPYIKRLFSNVLFSEGRAYYEVSIQTPRELLQSDEQKFSISWIDFYR